MLPFAYFDKNSELAGEKPLSDTDENLRFNNILLRAKIESSPDGMLVVDPT